VPYIDKTNYLRGLQCQKLLWHSFNRRESIPAPDASAQAIFDQGRAVGDLAQRMFPEGIDLGKALMDLSQAAILAQQALQLRRPLFEATFVSERASARIDVLVPVDAGRWDLHEIKSATSAKAVHLHDLAFQAQVLRDAGVNVRRSILVYINSDYVRHSGVDVNGLFVRRDVTDEVDALLAGVEHSVERMMEVIALDQCPQVPIGQHCDKPYTCPLHDVCWAHVPEHNVFTLVRVGAKAVKLAEQNILDIRRIPNEFALTAKQSIQKQAVINRLPYIDRPAVASFLAELKYPLHYVDFETVGPAIPLFVGTSPFEAVPFQFSLHIQQAPGATLEHQKYLAEGTGDPRREFMERLRAVLGHEGSVLVYNAAFEKSVLNRCAERLTEFKPWVASVKHRFVDLHLPFKRFDYYHPAQRGSTSIKNVLPALTGHNRLLRCLCFRLLPEQRPIRRRHKSQTERIMRAKKKNCPKNKKPIISNLNERFRLINCRIFGRFLAMKMKFVSYYRVSTDKQGLKGNGIEAQKQSVARYLSSLDCELLASFQEVESGANNRRPQLAAALQLAKSQKAILIIAKLDRLSRNAVFLLQLQDSKIDFVCCDMPNADRLSVGIIALLAQRERELISQRTKAGLAIVKARGTALGNPRPALALKKAQEAIQIRKKDFASTALTAIREIQSTGIESLNRIADCMNKRGEKTARGGAWTATAVKRCLACVG
jgi:DNA invertase Pin-like site-specific DNA recombinase